MLISVLFTNDKKHKLLNRNFSNKCVIRYFRRVWFFSVCQQDKRNVLKGFYLLQSPPSQSQVVSVNDPFSEEIKTTRKSDDTKSAYLFVEKIAITIVALIADSANLNVYSTIRRWKASFGTMIFINEKIIIINEYLKIIFTTTFVIIYLKK